MLRAEIKKIEVFNNSICRTILEDVSFYLPENKVFTIVGKNGSGKSTLIKSLSGLLDKTQFKVEGRVEFEGKAIFDLTSKELRNLRRDKIKYVFQDSIGGFDSLKKIGYYFQNLDVTEKEIDFELNYLLLPSHKKLFNLYPYEISGGMAQRLSFVLVLLAKPSLIILDELTSAVDPAVANLILIRLEEFVALNGNSAILITHDINFALKISDEIAFLDSGTLSKFRPPDLFFNKMESGAINLFHKAYMEIEN